MLAAVAISAAFVMLPYYAISPGGATDVASLVQVKDTRRYPPTGSILFTTVSIGRVNAYGLLRAWLDKDTEVWSEKKYLGGSTSQQVQSQAVRDMSDSKQYAAYVALRALGYPVKVTGDPVVVLAVDKKLPAATVLKPGDVISEVNGKRVNADCQFTGALQAHKPGDTVQLNVRHKGEVTGQDVSVKLGNNGAGGPLLGIAYSNSLRYTEPFPVTVDSGDVGGPSAGLAFTLGILDDLTKGELTGGQNVAVTGTIDPCGNVGEVGGVAQKTAAVRRSGAKLFIVPKGEGAEARAHAGKHLKIVEVTNLEGALKALAELRGSNALALGHPGAPAHSGQVKGA
jgi:PDZ domain-containing protein